MGKENKYYTPELKEFCVGFEYEERYLNWGDKWSEWGERIINNLTNLETFNRFINKEFRSFEDIQEYEYRVKHLDQSDIIDCGFMKVANDPVRQKWINALSFEGNDCRIELFPYIDGIPEQLRGVVTVFTTLSYGGCIKFHGKIKNKQELKTILKMIGVL